LRFLAVDKIHPPPRAADGGYSIETCPPWEGPLWFHAQTVAADRAVDRLRSQFRSPKNQCPVSTSTRLNTCWNAVPYTASCSRLALSSEPLIAPGATSLLVDSPG
jgi:hypothetical protein